jgi:sugar/nucleoside kinase (ribokinase family)
VATSRRPARSSSRPWNAYDAIALGQCAADTLCIVPHLPKLDTKLEVARFVRRAGGPAATAAATIQHLGGRTAFVGCVGDDAPGRAAIAALAKQGVDVTHTVFVPEAESHEAFILADPTTRTRTIVWTRGTAGLLEPRDIPAEVVRASRALLVDSLHIHAGIYAARIAQRADVPVFLDAGTAREGLHALLRRTDICFATRRCLYDLTRRGTTAERLTQLAALGPRIAGVTLGEEGSLAYSAADRALVASPAFEVNAVDTTGAGDAFHGAIAFALTRRIALAPALTFANAVAALACTALGAQAALPTREETLALIHAQRSASLRGLTKLATTSPHARAKQGHA